MIVADTAEIRAFRKNATANAQEAAERYVQARISGIPAQIKYEMLESVARHTYIKFDVKEDPIKGARDLVEEHDHTKRALEEIRASVTASFDQSPLAQQGMSDEARSALIDDVTRSIRDAISDKHKEELNALIRQSTLDMVGVMSDEVKKAARGASSDLGGGNHGINLDDRSYLVDSTVRGEPDRVAKQSRGVAG